MEEKLVKIQEDIQGIRQDLKTLLLLNSPGLAECKTTGERALFLRNNGLSPKDIANLLNTSSNYVSVRLSKTKGVRR